MDHLIFRLYNSEFFVISLTAKQLMKTFSSLLMRMRCFVV